MVAIRAAEGKESVVADRFECGDRPSFAESASAAMMAFAFGDERMTKCYQRMSSDFVALRFPSDGIARPCWFTLKRCDPDTSNRAGLRLDGSATRM